MSRAELELEGQALDRGSSIRMVCPFCHGGSSGERSLSLTHTEDGRLLFNCYRARCGAHGALGSGAASAKPARPLGTRELYCQERVEGDLIDLPCRPDAPYWGIPAYELRQLGVKWDPYREGLAFPIYAPNNMLRGRAIRRVLSGTGLPKTLTLPYEDGPMLAWNGIGQGARDTWTVVVEDAVSAFKLHTAGWRAVALLGTHLTIDGLGELYNNARNVVWALDRDAFAKALRLDQETRLLFERHEVLLLDKDFKDQSYWEIQDCLYPRYSAPSSRTEGHTNALPT